MPGELASAASANATHGAVSPATAVGSVWLRLRRRAGRSALLFAALCTAIALFLAAIDGHPLSKLVYSFAIGLSCWALIDGGRLLVAAACDGWRRLRGQPASTAGSETRWPLSAALLLLALVVGPMIGVRLVSAVFGTPWRFVPWDLANTGSRFTLAVTALGTTVSLIVMTALERLAAARARAEAAQRAAAEAQLRLLQSQLEPHMLFNTLANLRVLIGLDAGRAQAMLDRLVAFLRATLQASRRERHALADEFARVADYLALIQVRMGDRLRTKLDLPPALADLPVPPLLLQPLVENAVLHGLEPRRDGGRVEVAARRDGDRLVIAVRDTGVGLGDAAAGGGTGFGLQQVRERLATLYGKTAALTLEPAGDAEGGCRATLVLPIDGGSVAPGAGDR